MIYLKHVQIEFRAIQFNIKDDPDKQG